MSKHKFLGAAVAGIGAGAINGLFGAGGGMILIPLLTVLTDLTDKDVFSSSLAIMLPICIVALVFTGFQQDLPWQAAFPYLIGSTIGGAAAGIIRNKIPTTWLHRTLGLLIIWGGIRYLC